MSGALVRAQTRGVEVQGLLDELQAVKDQIAPEASDAELAVFARISAHLELDPFAGEVCLIGRYDREARRKVFKHQVTIAGRRVVAERTGRLAGIEGPVWCGPRLHDRACRCGGSGWLGVPEASGEMVRCPEAGALVWREVWDEEDYPYCARTLVRVRGWEVPANGTVKWDEFAQYVGKDEDRKLSKFWEQMPSHMLGKVSEALALRRAFQEVARAVTYGNPWRGDALMEPDDADLVAGAEAPTNVTARPASPSAPSGLPGPGPGRPAPVAGHSSSGAAAPGSRRPVERRRRPDEVPPEVYDNLPEAQGYAGGCPEDPGRPFE